ncbi:uncharacterized protein LOC143244061 isoform X3 [Tachypleus tridentatus]|uniref:uncharacterized protein LOC143244061 isoform X3 n=1 Tax=Tachypleus tridentatus TaxID=6853 RepID=UPI003FD46EAF
MGWSAMLSLTIDYSSNQIQRQTMQEYGHLSETYALHLKKECSQYIRSLLSESVKQLFY